MGRKEEEYFPRGTSSTQKPALRKTKDSLFKKYKKPKRLSKKKALLKEKKSKKDVSSSKLQPGLLKTQADTKHIIKPLTYQNLEEGTVVVGRIREIGQYHMFVNLPGRLSAKVSVATVSEPYTESLKKLQNLQTTSKECPPLNEMFRVGQAVVCCVMEKKREGDLLAVAVSLEPKLVNAARTHYTLRAGHTIIAAVSSEEDYGYTLHTGVAGLTAFLARNNTQRYVEFINGGRSLAVGEVLKCLVTKCVTGKSSSRVEVTVDPAAVARATLSDVSSQTLHPGSAVQCVVEERLKNGLVVKVGRNQAYVETSQLSQCWAQPKDYKPETKLKACVLYTLPQSDFQMATTPMYLTLKNINICVTPRIALGGVVDSLVTGTCPKGIFLCLGEKTDNKTGNKGFVSIRRLGEDIRKENIATKFRKGSRVTARILAFDYMEQLYNCSLERSTLQQQCVSVGELKVGDRVTCRVVLVEDNCLRLALGSVKLLVFKEHSADVPYSNLYEHFVIGDVVDGRVLNVNPELRQVSLTLKETLIRSPALSDYKAAHINACYWGTVRHVRTNSLLVTFYNDVTGTVRLDDHKQTFTPGQLVKCYVTYVNVQEEKMLLSLTPRQSKKSKQLSVGEVYELVVTEVFPDHFRVSATDHDGVDGIVYKCHQYDRIYAEGDFMKAWLYRMKAGIYHFSPNPAIQNFIKSPVDIKPLSKLTCYIEKISNKKVTVRTPLPEIPTADIPRAMWPEHEHPELHQIIRIYVEHIDLSNKSLVLSWKRPPKNHSNTEEVSVIDGTLDDKTENFQSTELDSCKKVEESNGIKLTKNEQTESDSLLTQSGKKRKRNDSTSEIDIRDERDKANTKKNEVKNQKEEVKASNADSVSNIPQLLSLDEKNKDLSPKIKKKNSKKNNTVLQQPLKNTTEDMVQDLTLMSKKKIIKGSKIVNDESGLLETKDGQKKVKGKQKKSSVEDPKKSSVQDPKKLTLSETGFLWDVNPEDLMKPTEEAEEDNDEEEEESGQGKKKKTAGERRRAAKEEEARLREVERRLMGSEDDPQTVDQYDRAVLARPDDADLWIKYMTHHLQATEIEKARSVARRALQNISQRLEAERLNVWIALLNLENLFGTQESLKSSLDEALRTNDEFTVYTKMLKIYSEANKSQETEQLVYTMLRKVRGSPDCWLHCCSALMKVGLVDKARNLLHRAITDLPTREHVNLLCKFALLENQYGFREQSETLFEHILTSYPKRTDVWSVYVDMLIKSERTEDARKVLERATKQKLPARKMKMLFSKWMSVEEKHGSPEKVEYVRKQAEAYVSDIVTKIE